MPYKSEKIKLLPQQDRRIKLTQEQKEEIKNIYSSGVASLNSLAKQFNVSKKTILLIVNPESARKNSERIKKHWKDYQTDKTEWAKIIREHRQYKQQLYLKGELKEEQKK